MAEKSYVTLKRAAAELGVHEQTLRSWERRGLIRMVHLPGSGYRRVPVAEIARLQQEMADPRRSAVKEVSMTYELGEQTLAPMVEAAPHRQPGGVTLQPPKTDADSLLRASRAEAAVRVELAELGSATTFDELLSQRRGRR